MKQTKQFIIAICSFIVLDTFWLGYVMKDFNVKQLEKLGRIEGGKFDILYFPALLVYILMAYVMVFFVLPKIKSSDSLGRTFLIGASMGLVIYGVYDLTNLSILKDYPILFSAADISWGFFVFGAVTVIFKILDRV